MKQLDVLIVGAGIAGIGAANRLTAAGYRNFVVLERSETVGGTWRDNRYPGVACDVPSHLYSYSFAPKADWTQHYAPGHEILEYLHTVASDELAAGRIRCGVTVTNAKWDPRDALWQIETTAGRMAARALVLAAGRLVDPAIPDISGLGQLGNRAFHTSAWPRGFDPAGQRIGVVGTGASAVQVVPELVRSGAKVTVFQRSAPWVLPRENRVYSGHEISVFLDNDEPRQRYRATLFDEAEAGFRARLVGTPELATVKERARRHLHTQVRDSQLREKLIPSYEIGCKRILLSDEWYPALASGNVTLEASALQQVDIRDADVVATAASEKQHVLDSVVLATGYNSARPRFAEWIHGIRGSLADHWRNGITSYGSIAVSGFPNCFILDGPNAAFGHNSAIYMIEAQLDYLLGAMPHLHGGAVLDIAESAEREYTSMIDRKADKTVWQSGCTSWYRDASVGRITLLWPDTAANFRAHNSTFEIHLYQPTPAFAG